MVIVTVPAQDLSEQDLLHLCQQTQHPAAFNTLVKRYLKPTYSYIFHLVQNPELAEDLTQETFLRAYRNVSQFDRSRPFKPWLFAIATNASKTLLLKQKHRLAVETQSSEDCLETAHDIAMAYNIVSEETTRQWVYHGLKQLAPLVRQAILLRCVHELTYEEIAAVMQANPNTVKTWVKRGKAELKQRLSTL